MWVWLAVGSAVFAALTSILAKIGIDGVGSNLHSNSHDGCDGYGMGDGIYNKSAEWYTEHQSEKLDFSDPFRAFYGCFVAMLL